jgi:hypothetical protein
MEGLALSLCEGLRVWKKKVCWLAINGKLHQVVKIIIVENITARTVVSVLNRFRLPSF